MSGFTNGTKCPNCDGNAILYSNWKPFDYTSIECPHCGLLIIPTLSYLNLEGLNALREEVELEPLEMLPPQSEDVWHKS